MAMMYRYPLHGGTGPVRYVPALTRVTSGVYMFQIGLIGELTAMKPFTFVAAFDVYKG